MQIRTDRRVNAELFGRTWKPTDSMVDFWCSNALQSTTRNCKKKNHEGLLMDYKFIIIIIEKDIDTGYIAEEGISFCSKYLERFQFLDKVATTAEEQFIFKFSSGGTPLGNVTSFNLDDNSLVQEMTDKQENPIRRRGRTTHADIQNMLPGTRIYIEVNENNIPCNITESIMLGSYLGVVTRDLILAQIVFPDWRNKVMDSFKKKMLGEIEIYRIHNVMDQLEWFGYLTLLTIVVMPRFGLDANYSFYV
ncbi:hypothetical protein IEQ34_002111 [Dendrobium chrysotoxum]|uniref:DUF4218 domain-containing protein n=1 Tax=Dendrobium chrysotoxum TaxID=161865 RepID=A0AAV7HKZ1_DENCH|nr:hypothetical protein IEQ34_002111 [Dendrobium chrysotoxum]